MARGSRPALTRRQAGGLEELSALQFDPSVYQDAPSERHTTSSYP